LLAEGRVLRSCMRGQENRGVWGFNKRNTVEYLRDSAAKSGGVGDAVLPMSGLWM
jgi:hypothetical protein